MKKYLYFIISFVAFNCNILVSYADSNMYVVTRFSQLNDFIMKFDENELRNTLIVMDNDDTLTMMECEKQSSRDECQYLGGPAWYNWQSDLIKNNVTSKYRVADDFGTLLQISALLLAMNYMPYVEDTIPFILKDLTDRGVSLLVLTARGGTNISATESQFSSLYLTDRNDENFLKLISKHALIGKKSGISSIASPVQGRSCKLKRAVSYRQGIVYVAGQNKGAMLQCILDKTDSSHIKNIVFIDDTMKNVDDVYNEFRHSKKYIVAAMYYTYLKDHKEAFLNHGREKKAHKRWDRIKSALTRELLSPAAIE